MAFSKLPDERRATKSVLESRTVLCAIVGMVASMASLFGYGTISCEEQARISEMLLPFFTLLSSFGAFIFRIFATRMIG